MPDAPAQAPVRAATKPRSAGLWIGACYNPHLGKEILASAELFDHLVIVDAPRQNDPHFPALRERVALPVHETNDRRAGFVNIDAARKPAERGAAEARLDAVDHGAHALPRLLDHAVDRPAAPPRERPVRVHTPEEHAQ